MFNPENLVKTISYTGMLYQLLSFISASQSKRSSTAFQKMCWEQRLGRWLPVLGAIALPARSAHGCCWALLVSHPRGSHYSTCCLSHASPHFEWLCEAFSKLPQNFLQCSTELSSVYPTVGFLGLTDFSARQRATGRQAPWSIISDFWLSACLSCVVATESEPNWINLSPALSFLLHPQPASGIKVNFYQPHLHSIVPTYTEGWILELSLVSLPLFFEPLPMQ